MGLPAEAVTFILPQSVVKELPAISDGLNQRMHELLERNTEGILVATERAELETLVQMAQFAQILAMATEGIRSK